MNIFDCITYNQAILLVFFLAVLILLLSALTVKHYRKRKSMHKMPEVQRKRKLSFELKGEIFELEKLSIYLEDLERYLVPIRTIFELNIIIEEIFASIINHQEGHAGEKRVSISIMLEKGVARVKITDSNKEFNPTLIPVIDLNAPLEEISFQGLGFHLVRNLADSVSYQRLGDQNVLTIIKNYIPDEKA